MNHPDWNPRLEIASRLMALSPHLADNITEALHLADALIRAERESRREADMGSATHV